MIEFTNGDMFDVEADIRVNTVNCVGVMGAGVALAFKQRYPDMFKDYKRDCNDGIVKPGKMHVWKSLSGDWIVNFPTKRHWREDSRYEDIEAGLDDLRRYLDSVGHKTIALPALGCGNGGLDWGRVSEMIREKLDGVDAHVLVFEPASSRAAGRSAVAEPTEDEKQSAKLLGFKHVASDQFGGLEGHGSLYVQGNPELLNDYWIAVLPSKNPGERELQAIRSIAEELSKNSANKTVSLVYGTRASEEVAEIFLDCGVDTLLLLPFGVLTRKAIVKRFADGRSGNISLVSTASATEKWSRQLFAKTMDMLRSNASATLVSDPEPEWLTTKGLGKWMEKPTSFIRYEAMPWHMREALESVGAWPMGRRSEDGSPNIDRLIGLRNSVETDPSNSIVETQPKTDPRPGVPERIVAETQDDKTGTKTVTLHFGGVPRIFDSEVRQLLSRLGVRDVTFSLNFAEELNEDDRRCLEEICKNQPES